MIFFVILVILACIILGFIILVQNPKGGGLAGNVAGFSNQFMGVKQTTDVLEKGTWVLAVVLVLLCIFSTIFIPKQAGIQTKDIKPVTNSQPLNNTAQPPASQPLK